MCFYCGCREIPLIRDFISEHEQVTELGAELVESLHRLDLDRARLLLDEVAARLATHWRGEEDGLFRELAREPGYRVYIEELEQDHRGLRELMAAADLNLPGDRDRLVRAMLDLQEHIAKEEDGLFPASLTALSGEQWDASIRAWEAAHHARLSSKAGLV